MSISKEGLSAKLESINVNFFVTREEPLIQLANALDWEEMGRLVQHDLEKTKKRFWFLGRRLYLRTHLGAMVLQSLKKETDRGMEESLRVNPIYKVFCGYGLISRWNYPDHTKLEVFRNRLSPETHKSLGDYVLKVAHKTGFLNPSWMDLDSTVQEANMTYPSDVKLMQSLSQKCKKVIDFLIEKKKILFPNELNIDLKMIKKKVREYFFLSGKPKKKEAKIALFGQIHELVKSQLKKPIMYLKSLNPNLMGKLPWNIGRELKIIKEKGLEYLDDVGHFVQTRTVKKGKALSLHLSSVVCICKGKIGKSVEFGRQVQLGRVGGNFLLPLSLEVKMEDKKSLTPMVANHSQIFGQRVLQQIGTDKGYYSSRQIQNVSLMGINTDGVQRPARIKGGPLKDVVLPLANRRAGIEPLIGHAKLFGLAKSKMKSDRATHSSVYRCVMAFNLHQFVRHLTGKFASKNPI